MSSIKALRPDKTPRTGRFRISDILDEVGFDQRQERTVKLKRSSGSPQGRLENAMCVRKKRWPEQQYLYPQPYGTRDYAPVPPPAPYPYQQYPYGANPPPQQYLYAYGSNPPPQQYRFVANPRSGYPCVANPPPQGFPVPYGGSSGYGSGPSYAYGESEKHKGSKFGVGTGLAVGAVAGDLGGLALAEGTEYVEDKIADNVADKVEDDLADQGGYDDYVGGDDFSALDSEEYKFSTIDKINQ